MQARLRRPTDPALWRLLLFAGGLAVTLTILLLFRRIFLPLLLGLAIAYLFDPAVSWFEKRGRSRVFGVIVLTLVLLLALAGLVLYLVPAIGDQVDRLGEQLPRYQERLDDLVGPWRERIESRYPEQLEALRERAQTWLEENSAKVLSGVGELLKGAFRNLASFMLALLNLVFVPVFAFYLLVDFPKIKAGAAELVPVPYRDLVFSRLREVDEAVSSFIRGQLTIALVLAAINATGLLILRVPLGLVIGIVAGLANLIPYMALVVGLAPALLLAWAEHQSWLHLAGVMGVFSGAQLLEGTVLSPRILGKSVNLHPVWILLAIIIGGSMLGFFGMLLAVPVAASIQVFAVHWLEFYRTSRIYRGEAREEQAAEEKPGEPAGEPEGEEGPRPANERPPGWPERPEEPAR